MKNFKKIRKDVRKSIKEVRAMWRTIERNIPNDTEETAIVRSTMDSLNNAKIFRYTLSGVMNIIKLNNEPYSNKLIPPYYSDDLIIAKSICWKSKRGCKRICSRIIVPDTFIQHIHEQIKAVKEIITDISSTNFE